MRTALKPKWIATLLGCLLAATAFVLLSQWQFGRSSEAPPPPSTATERPVPLTEHFQPGRDMYVPDADQIVTATGRFLPDSAVLISGRLHEGEQGYWSVAGFLPDGAEGGDVMPVVRGWEKDPTEPAALPDGNVSLKGRLLPSESPSGTRRDEHGAYPELSAQWLANVWDHDSYAGFVVIFDAHGADGSDVGAASAGLEPVKVGTQPPSGGVNWLNVFYGVEWIVFAGFALFIWWRLVRDDAQREAEYEAELAAWRTRQAAREAAAVAAAAASSTSPRTHLGGPQGPHGSTSDKDKDA